MPQLDHVTYFTQFFWLTVFFLSFYVILVKSLLPRVATILKLRKKLMDTQVNESQNEEVSKEVSAYDRIVMNSLQQSKALLTGTSESTQNWSNETYRQIQQGPFASSQELYLQAVGQMIAKKHILKSLLEESK
uniref:H(+)-transporting two-sector ATPase n=1 Tax=Andalucia godoyi TaxID=505711 RepID=M4QCN7_ANDGO|nr:ATP synthase F0 subunit 8 [Andalucia godoyi]AGH23960.1 ATP synthase F0 subunit 8 [Andalucia godoyi]